MPKYKENFGKEYFERLLSTIVSSSDLYDRCEAIDELRSQLQQLDFKLQDQADKERVGGPITREKRAGSGVPY